MDTRLSLLMITKNSGSLLEDSLKSVDGLVGEKIIVDDCSTDDTVALAKKYGSTVYTRRDDDLGRQRNYGLSKCSGEWILMLDADERVSPGLRKEISGILRKGGEDGYFIPYQNHFLGIPLHHGGEDYRIMRLFRKGRGTIPDELIHEHARITGAGGILKNKIIHYSYRSIGQVYSKFTDYARREAVRKRAAGEGSSLGKLVRYPLHMFYARYIKDKGYKDTPLRILLDAGFAYMEFMTYFHLLFQAKVQKKP